VQPGAHDPLQPSSPHRLPVQFGVHEPASELELASPAGCEASPGIAASASMLASDAPPASSGNTFASWNAAASSCSSIPPSLEGHAVSAGSGRSSVLTNN
jgi:hypothetical protein